MDNTSARHDRGLALLRRIGGSDAEHPVHALAELMPDLAFDLVAFGYGDVLSRAELDLKTRELATVAALGALGNASPQLAFHVEGALNVGCEPWELLELVPILAVFSGFPAALNATGTLRTVFERRGLRCTPESPLGHHRTTGETERRALGLTGLDAISQDAGRAVLARIQHLAPALADWLLDFSYCDVLSRPGLGLRTKELAIVALLTAIGRAEPQLRVHLQAALNVGCTRTEILEIIQQMASYAGFPASLNALAAVRDVIEASA